MLLYPDNEKAIAKKRKWIIPFIMVFLLFGFAYIVFINMQAYQKYGYCVVVEGVETFAKSPLPQDLKFNGRILIKECIEKDKSIDNGDGPKKGKVRWYECTGPDCDEGWRKSFRD